MRKSLLLASGLLLCSLASAQLKVVSPKMHGIDPSHLDRIDTLVVRNIHSGNIPGAVVAVVHGGDIVYLKAFGDKQVVPERIPMTTETMFDLASVSKCVGTTLAAMRLIERGEIRPKDEVRYFFPEFRPWIDPETGEKVHITIQDLMSHSSGLSPYINVESFVQQYGENQPDSLMRFIATQVKRNFRPRTDFMYSCLNYITLQHIIQQVTAQPLNVYVEENIFQPLGLEHTCYFPLGADLRTPVAHQELIPLCAPTEVQADGLPLVAAVHDPIARRINAGVSGNAGVFSNAEDLAVICQMILNRGTRPVKIAMKSDPSLLMPATVRMMCTIPKENDPKVGRALGWDKKSDHSGLKGDYFNPDMTIEHTGYTGTSVLINFESRTALIILTNRVHPNDDGAVGRMRAQIANVVAALTLPEFYKVF